MESVLAEPESPALDALLEKVYRDTGYDFRDYKRGTVTRRLARRMYVAGAGSYPEYVRFLHIHPEEYQQLADYLTIKASSFFRSHYAFQVVAGRVLPGLFSRAAAAGRGVSFWSAACARGEEPYSIAIMLAEFLAQHGSKPDVSVYASDISRWALGEAQAGIYSPGDVATLPPELAQLYLAWNGQQYEVQPAIRRMVTFSFFDLASATLPPFKGVDCIFCCNVLIYLERRLQARVLDRLCDALAAGGYLVLGEVETPASSTAERLECLDSRARVYRKRF